MVNLKFGAFIFALCLLLKSCVCEQTNPCTIQDTIATCESIENFKSLPSDATNITKLIVRSKELKRIDKDDLTGFVNLEEIDISNSGLEEIDENAFAGLAKLHKINLAGNTKLKVPNDASFISSNTLTCLNLSNTVVEQLDKTFAHLPQLQNLDLSGTNVKDFSPLKLQEHLEKLVVSKTNETKDLCSVLSIKEIFEKDANETEIPLDCKTGEVDVNAKEEGKDQTTPKIEEPPTTEKKPEVTTEAPVAAPKGDPKDEEIKETEAPTAPEKIEDPKGLENAAQNLTNKAEDTPKIVNEGINKEITTDAVTKDPIPENENGEKQSTTIATVTKEQEHPVENPEEKEKTDKPEENTVIPAITDNVEETKVTEQPKINNEEKNTDTKPEKKAKLLVKDVKDKYDANEKPAVLLDASEDAILPSTANTSQSNGVNIVLGIILCVMIVGAMGFGYKYWKNRRSGYTHANTQDHDDEDKELQTIVAHRTDPDQN